MSKKIQLNATILIFIMAVSLNAHSDSETYSAPSLKIKSVQFEGQASEGQASWRSHYRVQDQPAPERALASDEWVDADEKPVSRDPSSLEDHSGHGLKPWPYHPKD
jgi:hypothetical protein